MPETITFKTPFDGNIGDLTSRIIEIGFKQNNSFFEDAVGRKIVLSQNYLELTMPATGLIDEQEQLEYILGNLGLDPDNAKAI